MVLGSMISLYSDKKSKNLSNEKNTKITQRAHGFKDFTSSYDVKIVNSFNPELQLKDAEYAVKK